MKTLQNMHHLTRKLHGKVKSKTYNLQRDKSGKIILPDEKEKVKTVAK